MFKNSKIWYLENFNLFEGMSHKNMMELAKRLNMKQLTKDEVIYFAEEPSSSLYLLKEGQVKLTRISNDGREIITALINPGEIFGEFALSENDIREDTAIATGDAVICAISRENFEDILIKNPGLNLKVTKFIGLKLQKVRRDLESLIFKDSASRIIHFLKRYSEDFGKKIGGEIFIRSNLTHQDIANLTATSRQTVTTVLNNLKNNRIIDFDRNKIIIRDPSEINFLLSK